MIAHNNHAFIFSLPKDKQFLITRNVPCYKRCRQMDYSPEQEKVIDDAGDDGEGWVDTHHFAEKTSTLDEKVSEMKLEDDDENEVAADEEGSDEEAVDMEAFVESGLLEVFGKIILFFLFSYLVEKELYIKKLRVSF